ncbi:Peroxisomal membrane protein 4 [Smittium culicis]|uniref:Peroxisomal membrane protein 4 n=1 Tax=Smittium culicis TaxID=133412 RepID=A0A1R1X3V8_9FUNG|nr:Peroxisomal membrane protein 4 [Smittium culicis]OMJ20475.1 Peroxisomal membrane protein 4 [Smittium culicis]
MDIVEQIVRNPRNKDILSIVKAARNGLVNGSLKKKLTSILKATREHSFKLGTRLDFMGEGLNTFVSGFVGGYLVFGKNDSINNQLALYLFSRTITAIFKKGWSASKLSVPDNAFAIFSALCWGTVMMMHSLDSKSLQASLTSSMDYIYFDSEKWSSLFTLLWHNK